MKLIYQIMSIAAYGLALYGMFTGGELVIIMLMILMGGECDSKARIINLEERI